MAQIFARIREKTPTAWTDDQLAVEADIVHKRIYRLLKLETFLSFELIEGQPMYPIALSRDDVTQVTIGNTATIKNKYITYPRRKSSDTASSNMRYHYFVSGYIGLYPPPTSAQDTAVVYYYEIPPALTADSPAPMLDERYHMMIVYGVCKEIAENYRDTDRASGFAEQYNALESELIGYTRTSEEHTVRNEMGW